MPIEICPICGPQEFRQAPKGQTVTFCISCNRTRAKAQEWADEFRIAEPVKPLTIRARSTALSGLLGLVGISRDPVIVNLLHVAEAIREDLKSRILLGVDSAIEEFVTFVRKWPKKFVDGYKDEMGKGLKPEHCVYNFIIRKAAERLTDGNMHIYPGVLGTEGNALYDLFLKSVSNMVAMGAYSQEWATENWRKPVAQGIRESG